MNAITVIILSLMGTLLVLSIVWAILSNTDVRALGNQMKSLFDWGPWRSFLNTWREFTFVEEDTMPDGTRVFQFDYHNRYFCLIFMNSRRDVPYAAIFSPDDECALCSFNKKMSHELARRLLFRHWYGKDVTK